MNPARGAIEKMVFHWLVIKLLLLPPSKMIMDKPGFPYTSYPVCNILCFFAIKQATLAILNDQTLAYTTFQLKWIFPYVKNYVKTIFDNVLVHYTLLQTTPQFETQLNSVSYQIYFVLPLHPCAQCMCIYFQEHLGHSRHPFYSGWLVNSIRKYFCII